MSKSIWRPQKSSSIPLNQQITEHIKQKIMAGEWTVGFKLPPQRALAEHFQVNRSTIVTALEELIADGLVESKRGSGTQVANNTWNILASDPPDWTHYVQSGIHAPNLAIIQEVNKAEADPAVIRLGTGELSPELLPIENMKKTMQLKQHQPLALGYIEPKGSLSLRQSVSDYLKPKGIDASPDSILIVSGAIQALQLIAVGLLKRGATILHETPSYLNSIHVFQSAGMKLLGIPLDEAGMEAKSIGRLKRQYDGALLYTIPSFHNPTGKVMSKERRQELLEISQRESLPIIEDDVYGELWFDEQPPPPLKADDRQGNVLYVGSVSKTLSPGLRIGWLVGPEPVITRLADIKMQTDYGSSSISQHLVEEWLRSGMYQEFISQTRQKLKERRDFTLGLLTKYFASIATWDIPKGGFYIWLKLNGEISVRKLFDLALKEGILLNPGIVYDKMDQNHFRISYSYASKEELEKGLRRLSEIIKNF